MKSPRSRAAKDAVAAGMAAARDRGVRLGRPATLSHGSALRVEELAGQGVTLNAIAQALNAEGVESASGRPWTKASVSYVLGRRHRPRVQRLKRSLSEYTLPPVSRDELPPRVLTDPQELRAVAHPVRLRLLDELAFGGPATATELSQRIGQSPANCSWHLRQLAKYRFVEETGGGDGRQRPWQIVIQRKQMARGKVDEGVRIATVASQQRLAATEFEALQTWLAAAHEEPVRWRDSLTFTQNVGWCTAEELARVQREASAVFDQFVHRVNNPQLRPAGSRPVRFMAWGVPARRVSAPTEER